MVKISVFTQIFIILLTQLLCTEMLIPDIIIAIDGYSSTGKSTFAKRIAAEVSFLYLDSGALYRAVTLYAIEKGIISPAGNIDRHALCRALDGLDIHFESKGNGSRTYIGDRCVEGEIRTLAVSERVSPVSAVPEVRSFIDDRLREFGRRKRVVMDGRDIGTTVFPDAELKIFMTADQMVRARRRADEMNFIDSHRDTSPLSMAEDAVVLDNSYMTIEDQMVWFRRLVAERFPMKES